MTTRAADRDSATSALARDSLVLDAELTVRVATIADLDTVVELRLALVREHRANPLYSRLRPDAPILARRHFASQLRSSDEVIFLAEHRGHAVGILRCVQVAGIPLALPVLHGYISSVYVVPEARRQGVLRRLFAEALAWCRSRGLEELRLHNAVENEAANAAWESLGFETAEYLRVRRIT
ncbi:MAG TPA: GNAT family N-acetyltransferase [Gemmatimonadaceae bacterium]|nr:GNAT family N-acetyltransferase [Gemmatimonadaceae bacterium]